jgi:hypothetical protein
MFEYFKTWLNLHFTGKMKWKQILVKTCWLFYFEVRSFAAFRTQTK